MFRTSLINMIFSQLFWELSSRGVISDKVLHNTAENYDVLMEKLLGEKVRSPVFKLRVHPPNSKFDIFCKF